MTNQCIFPNIRALFKNFLKVAGETSPSLLPPIWLRACSGVNKDFIRNLIWQQKKTTAASKKYLPATTKYQPIHIRKCFEIYNGKDLC